MVRLRTGNFVSFRIEARPRKRSVTLEERPLALRRQMPQAKRSLSRTPLKSSKGVTVYPAVTLSEAKSLCIFQSFWSISEILLIAR